MSLSDFLNEHKLFSFEGESGVKKLEVVLKEIGYKESGFAYGSAVENFLQDNPGAIQAILDFIEEHYEDDFERYTDDDEEPNNEEKWAVIDCDEFDDNMNMCVKLAQENNNQNILQFVAEAQEAGLEVWYYRGRNFYYGPAVTLDNLNDVPFSSLAHWQYDNLGMKYVVYPVKGLTSDVMGM